MLVTDGILSDPSQVESATFYFGSKDPDEVTTSTMMVALDADDFGADGSFSRATTIPDSFAGGTLELYSSVALDGFGNTSTVTLLPDYTVEFDRVNDNPTFGSGSVLSRSTRTSTPPI